MVFENIAENPDVRQIRNGEWVGGAEARHARGIGDLLVGDHAGNRSYNVNSRCRVVDAAAEDANPLRGVLHVDLGLVLDILRGLEIVQRDSTFVVEQLGAVGLYSSELFVGDRLSIFGK